MYLCRFIYPAQLDYSEQALSHHDQHNEIDGSLVDLGAGSDPYHDISDQNVTNEQLEGYGDNGDLSPPDDNDPLQPYDETVATNHGQYIANLLQ